MGLLGIYNIYKTVEEKSSHRRSKSSSTNSNNQEHDHNAISILDIVKEHTITSDNDKFCNIVASVLKSDTATLEVFKKLLDYSLVVRNNFLKQNDTMLIALAPAAQDFIETSLAIEGLGFRITKEEPSLRYIQKSNNSRGYSFKERLTETSLNGIDLTPEALASGKNPYAERLDAFRKENPNAEQNFTHAKQMVEDLSKNKFLLRISKNRRTKLAEAQTKLQEAEQTFITEQGYVKDSNFFANLTEEQKSFISEYLIKREQFKQLVEEQSKIETERSYIEGHHYIYATEEEIKAFNEINSSILNLAKQNLTSEELQCLECFYSNASSFIASCSDEDIENLSRNSGPILESRTPTSFALTDITSEVYKRTIAELQQMYDESLSDENLGEEIIQ